MAILLTSSDARPLYVQDIMTAVAAPRGAVIQFRYDIRYVTEDLWAMLESRKAVGKDAIVAFVGNISIPGDEYLVPVRLAKIVDVKAWGGRAAIVRMEVRDYPDMAGWSRTDQTELVAKGKQALKDVFDQYKSRYNSFRSAMATSNGLPTTGSGSSEQSWLGVTDRLALLDTFVNSYFLYLALVNSTDPSKSLQLSDGRLELPNRQGIIVKSYYTRTSSPASGNTRELSVSAAESSILSIASDSKREILSRYDEVDFWFQAKPVQEKSRTILTALLPGDSSTPGDQTTRVLIPVTVYKPIARRVARGFAGAAGAGLVAAPALMGPGSNFTSRVIIACIGAFIVAMLAVFSS
jgi:hypothetical protein